MSKNLEDFVKNNRDDFDKFEPGPVVWHNIQQQLKKPAGKEGIHISMKVLRWSAAAAIILALGAGTWYYLDHNKKNTDNLAGVKKQPAATNDLPAVAQQDTKKETIKTPENKDATKVNNEPQLAQNDDADYNEELVHYARLVELKQNQIKKIKKDEPLLYQQFAGDFNKLDSTFHILKKQLPVNPNREQILEAMIQNLQYQEALLNQQLNIIKKINNTKKEAYEKAYRSA
ncbi:MAG TPA: hypothetical protein VK645_16600 [Chitinophagaceae bacterium]|nr:hypothetical protein [Chitinophagaceae bacterium]